MADFSGGASGRHRLFSSSTSLFSLLANSTGNAHVSEGVGANGAQTAFMWTCAIAVATLRVACGIFLLAAHA